MEKLSSASNFLDLGGLDSLRSQARKDEKGALKEAAQQFEGIFIQMLMKSMRDANAAFKSDSPMNSETTEFFEQMRDQQMSVDLSNKGMLGLAELMVQQLSPNDSPVTPASALRGDAESKVNPSMFVESNETHDLAAILNGNEVAVSHSAIDQPSLTHLAHLKLDSALPQTAVPIEPRQQLANLLSGRITPTELSTSDLQQVNKAKAPVRKGLAVSEFNGPQHFISVLYPHAEKAAKKLGTTPELLIAQSALETGWGQKVIRRNDGEMSHNLFNIKADKRWGGDKTSVNTLEFEKGIPVQQKADFRMYESVEASFNDFVSFLSNGDRYQDALKVAAEPTQFIRALQKAGYATDPQYANKIINVMKSVTEGVKAVFPKENK